MVKDIATLTLSSSPHNLSFASGKLYFSVEDGSDELWTSDGSSGGTNRVKDINTSGGDDVSVVVGLGGGIGLFAANDGTNGRELWKTDGSEGNTQLVLDANPGAGSGVASFTKSNAVVAGTLLYFNADDGIHGVELWKSDGTGAGTAMVKDICPGTCSSNPTSLVASGTKVYFRASNPYVGDEVWVSDGTGAGTALTGDLEPGNGGSSPASLAKSGNLVYFSATTTASGNELHAICTTTATHYLVTGPSVVSPGSSTSIVVTPLDASNVPVPCYSGTVHFTSTDGAATLPGDYTFVIGEGAHTFSATFNTTGNITITATDTVTGTINGNTIVPVKLTTTTTLVSSENPSLTGQSVTFTATVSSLDAGTITGTVTFKDGAATIGSGPVSGGTATFTTSALAHGVHSITAEYGGDTNFGSSVSDPLSQTVNTSAFGPPVIFLATATNSTNVALGWTAVSGATSYEVWRSSGGSAYAFLTSTGGTNLNDSVSANTTYLYKVRAVNGGGPSGFSSVDAATTVVFTDASLSGVLVKAVHLTQLRTAVNAMRAAASLGPATFTDPSPAGVTIKAVHITELRTALDAARSVIGLSVLAYTDPTITPGVTTAKAAHTAELRAGTQ
jgi:ELWxxDGT repeat protein